MRARLKLQAYLAAVGLVGLGLLAVACRGAGLQAFSAAANPWAIAALALAMALGELRPIKIARGSGQADEISIASTIGISMIIVAPIGLVVASQTLGLVLDELRRWVRREPRRSSALLRTWFNVGQYSLALMAARATFSAVESEPFILRHESFGPRMLMSAWLAAATFFLINSWLTSIAFAVSNQTPIAQHLRADWRWQILSSAALLGLGPVVAQAVLWSPVLLPFLLLPLGLVHQGAALAARREHEALHDQLTGLPNRGLLLAHIEESLAGPPGALLLLDLDHFKEVNDTLGHLVGDSLIQAVSDRLSATLRADEMLARLGGDEFAVVARNTDADGAAALGDRVVAALDAVMHAKGFALQASISAGIALWPDHGDTVEQLLQRADVALYAAKELRGRWQVYEPGRDHHSVERLVQAASLRTALLGEQIQVAFQPQVLSRRHRPVGVEALVRWNHPETGPVSPETIVGLATGIGALSDLTATVIDRSLAVLVAAAAAGHDLTASVNLTARQLSDPTLPSMVAKLLLRHGVSPHKLTLEVIESALMLDAGFAPFVLPDLRRLGVQLSIDDFGTGYSSLAQLQRLAPHELKIDQSFTKHLVTSNADRTIVRSTIDLGHSLGLRVVAEGVETDDVADILESWGCDLLQGYGLAMPMFPPELLTWLGERDLEALTESPLAAAAADLSKRLV